jgi:hypothetical protein
VDDVRTTPPAPSGSGPTESPATDPSGPSDPLGADPDDLENAGLCS